MNHPRGFTFMELVLAISLTGIVGVIMVNFVNNSFDLWRLIRNQQELQFQARTALRLITTEIREMQDSSNGSFAIASADPNEFIFYSNVDADGDIERVRYFFSSNALQRGIIQPTGNPATYLSGSETVGQIIDGVYLSGDMFSYYDESYTGTEDPLADPFDATDVHLIKIRFFVDDDATEPPNGNEITTEITPRNLKEYAPAT